MGAFKVVEWVPRAWWVVWDHPGRGYTPLEGPFPTRKQAEDALAKMEKGEQP